MLKEDFSGIIPSIYYHVGAGVRVFAAAAATTTTGGYCLCNNKIFNSEFIKNTKNERKQYNKERN